MELQNITVLNCETNGIANIKLLNINEIANKNYCDTNGIANIEL